MTETDQHHHAPAALTAGIPYTLDTGEKLVNETFGPNNIHRRASGSVERYPMTVCNGRPLASQFTLDRNGFTFVDHNTAVRDFFGPALQQEYYPEVEQLVRQATGAARVMVFDHTLRSGDESERSAKLLREPVLWAHNDYTEWSGPQRVRDLLPDEAAMLLARRFAIIQVWRATGQRVQSNPLALADARSVVFDDLMIAERRYPNRVGQTYRLRHNPAHRWFYFPEMRRSEALVFKTYDSARDGRARFTAHTSFDDPHTPPGAPPRQSIETRALAFFAG
jgi:hypothetical protein